MELDKSYVEKVDESIGELQMVIRDLKDLVAKDGVVTEEESKLLNSIKDNLEKYYDLLEHVIEDNVITEDEYNSMKEYEKKLLSEANFKAWEDGQLSDDERNILSMLKKAVGEIGTLEYK